VTVRGRARRGPAICGNPWYQRVAATAAGVSPRSHPLRLKPMRRSC
jgi:hypothetical protein